MCKPKVLITGCCGHIGSHLIRDLELLDKYSVYGIDNFLTQRYCSIFKLEREFVFEERRFESLTEKELENYDSFIHLAAITNAVKSLENPGETEELNVKATIDLFQKIINVGGKQIIFPSSTSVYGTNVLTVDETAQTNPQSPYASSKIQVEQFLQEYCSNYIVLRFGTIFGVSPGIRFHTAVNSFCWKAFINQPLEIWKQNYHQFRPYLGLNDATSSVKMALSDMLKRNDIYNVLTDNLTTEQIVEAVKSFCKYQVSTRFVNTPLLNQFNYLVDDTKIRMLGYNPRDSVFIGIKETLNLLGCSEWL